MKRIAATAVLALAAAMTCGSILHAQEPEIVIEAKKKKAIRAFVEALAQAGPTDQVGRWKHEICPIVTGISEDQANWITDRIVEIARSVDLKRAPSNCLPSLIVFVTPEPDRLVKEIEDLFPRNDGVWKLHRFDGKPVRWVSLTDECGYGCALPNTRLVKATTPIFTAVVILVDSKSLDGRKLGELADYVAFVGLTNPRPSSVKATSSIMSLFESEHPAGVEFSLTERDQAFLTGLYRSRANSSFREQRGVIEEVMKRRAPSRNPAPESSKDE